MVMLTSAEINCDRVWERLVSEELDLVEAEPRSRTKVCSSLSLTLCSLLSWLSLTAPVLSQTPPPDITVPPGAPGAVEQTIPPAPQAPPTPPALPEPLPPALQTPPAQPSPPTPELPPVRFRVNRIEVVGSTVLQPEINQLIQQYENREVTFEELIDLRSQITKLYVDNGYITSGAFLPSDQDLTDGVVRIQVVEGKLGSIEISGLQRLGENYVRSRLERGGRPPLNRFNLERSLQLLQLDDRLIRRVNAELTAGTGPGLNTLRVAIEEAPPLRAGIFADNYQSVSTGSEQVSAFVDYANLLRLGDRIYAQYGLTRGQNLYDLSYTVPVNALDGAITLRYSNTNSNIIEEEFERFGIRSEARTISAGVRQALFRSASRELALGLTFDLRRSQTFIQDNIPFAFSEGVDKNGESRVSVLRFSQDWLDRGRNWVVAARSQFSLGLDAFDATVNDTGTDGRFFSWLGQFQYVRQISPRVVALTRVNAQLTPDSLLSLERFSLGGVDTVRGYRQNQLVADNGISASAEVRFSLTRNPERLYLAPFVEAGYGWNNRTPNASEQTLASVGLSMRWLITSNLSLRLDYGIPLINVENRGNSLQDNGLFFFLRYQPF